MAPAAPGQTPALILVLPLLAAGCGHTGADESGGDAGGGGADSQCTVFYPDDDGDGVGHSDEERDTCADPTQAPAGYAYGAAGEDCADDDPTVSPHQAELLGDSVDSDCDGAADPECLDHPLVDGRQLPDPSSTTQDCAGSPDLAIVGLLGCYVYCAYHFYVVVGNLGTARHEGSLVIDATDLLRSPPEAVRQVEVDVALSPGEGTAPILLGTLASAVEVRLATAGTGDCDASNDFVAFDGVTVDCVP